MPEGEVMNEEDLVQALNALRERKVGAQARGDGFDMGGDESYGNEQQPGSFLELLSNPQQLANSLNLNRKQAENIRSLITGSGAGLASKFLARTFGDEIAGAIGGFLGGYVSKRILK